jgi:hypothetical protein
MIIVIVMSLGSLEVNFLICLEFKSEKMYAFGFLLSIYDSNESID